MSDIFPLVARGATSKRGKKTLVGPIDLTLQGTGTTVVVGPNGSGKTSLLRMLHGAARLSAGDITWACSKREAYHHQSFVFQRPIMLRRSVLENLVYPLQLRGEKRDTAQETAVKWAQKVGLDHMLDRQAPVLSGGEQQKLALARALITGPKLLFLDEPCAALDGRAMREIEEILVHAKSMGTRLIVSTHDMGQARRLADDVVFMLRGCVHERNIAATFFDQPETLQARAFLNGDIVE